MRNNEEIRTFIEQAPIKFSIVYVRKNEDIWVRDSGVSI